MIAGAAANAALAQAQGMGQGQGQGKGQGQGTSSAAGKQGAVSSQSKGGGASTGGSDRKNQPGPGDPLEQLPTAEGADSRTATLNGDTNASPRAPREPPWFSRLPPDQQQALRKRPPPCATRLRGTLEALL